jgi:hypothetical protein
MYHFRFHGNPLKMILGTEELMFKYLPAPTMPICQHSDAIFT